MRQALERRLGIVFGSGVVILFLIGALQNQSVIRLTSAIRGVTESHGILEDLARLDSRLSDAVLGAEGYEMTGDRAYLESYRAAATRVPGILRKLQPPAGGNPNQSQEWAALASQTGAALTELQRVAEARTPGPHPALPLRITSLKAVDEARQAIRKTQQKERALMNQRKGAVQANSRLATLSTTLGAALALWLLIVASLVIHRYVDERRRSGGTQVLATEVLRNLGQAVYLADETGMVLYANPAADTMSGYEPGKLVGIDVAKLNDLSQTEDGLDLASQIHAQLAKGAAWIGILTSYRKDRASFLSSARISAVEFSGKSYWLFVQDDLTQHGQSDDSSEVNRKYSPEMPEALEPLTVESAGR
ncbi:MAG TPA: CHASE3 domain-containing protein [Terriglobia bacterium]|nr:CHASE3 domain-containing protein [Terriglobia bacterium]